MCKQERKNDHTHQTLVKNFTEFMDQGPPMNKLTPVPHWAETSDNELVAENCEKILNIFTCSLTELWVFATK